MINFDMLQLLYFFSIFVVSFLCITKIILNNSINIKYKNHVTNRMNHRYERINDLTVDNYNIYNKFMIWLFVTES